MLISMFLRQGMWLTAIGIVIGLATAFVSMRLMASLLFNVSPLDPWTTGLRLYASSGSPRWRATCLPVKPQW
ncbi:MAG: hypothetical protein WCA10_13845 [Terracidiphilus sp.]